MKKRITSLFLCIFVIFSINVPFSFANYTVDFHYNDMVYSINGGSNVFLSEIFSYFNYTDYPISDVEKVFFSNEKFLEIKQQNSDWLLTSLVSFNTEEYLTIEFTDGETLIIKTTDNVDIPIFTDQTDLTASWMLTSNAFHEVTVNLYNESGSFIASSKCTTVISSGWLEMSSPYYWFEIMSSNKCGTLNYSSIATSSKQVVTLGALPDSVLLWCSYKNDHYINVKKHSNLIYDSSNPYCSVRQTSEFVLNGDTEYRYVRIYVDNREVSNYTGYNSTFLFPDRQLGSKGEDTLYASDLSVYPQSNYEYVTTSVDSTNKTYNIYLKTKTYTAAINTDAGVGSVSGGGTYKYNSSVTFDANVKTGYLFDGWYNGNTKLSSNQSYTFTMPANNIAYTAKTNPISYSVAFHGNGATSGDMANQHFIYDVPQAISPVTYKLEYTVTYDANDGFISKSSDKATASFKGWLSSLIGSNIYNDQQIISNLVIINGATVDFYADWELGKVILPTPERQDYNFTGWYTENGMKIGDAGFEYTPLSDITLYAQWEKLSNTINYNAGEGGTVSLISETIDATTGTVQGSTAIPNEGYQFVGWYSDSNYSHLISSEAFYKPTNITATYYAKFEKIKYNITYITDDEVGAQSTEIKYYGIDYMIPDEIPTRSGYTFAYWSTNPNGLGSVYSPGDIYTDNANMMLYAQWIKNEQTADLTISKMSPVQCDENQVFVYIIKGVANTETSNFYMTVTSHGNNDVVVHDLPAGKYIIEEDNQWTWQYNIGNISQEINVQTNRINTAFFLNIPEIKIPWLISYGISTENIYGIGIGNIIRGGEK